MTELVDIDSDPQRFLK